MATKTIVTCDMCGKEPATTVAVAAAGAGGDVDLCERHAKALTTAVEPYISAGRTKARTARSRTKRAGVTKSAAKRVTAKKAVTETKRRSRRGSNVAAIRNWGLENGFEVATRGRLKPELVAAHAAANKPVKKAK